jgi:hypothetical protein
MNGYVFAHAGQLDPEYRRLELLDAFHRAPTLRGLDAIGVGPGWRCWDAGAGIGGISRVLAERVGPSGRVLATDIDLSFLEARRNAGIEIQLHDVTRDRPPHGAFDLAHARLLLLHLPDPVDAIRRMVAALRPGAWLLVGDVDLTTLAPTDSAEAVTPAWKALCDFLTVSGVDVRCGPKLESMLTSAGLVDVVAESMRSEVEGGGSQTGAAALSLRHVQEGLIGGGHASGDAIDAACRQLGDPHRVFSSTTVWTAWGRRNF